MELPIQKAAMVLGVLPSTLKKRVKEGEIEGYQRDSTWYVELPESEPNLVPIKSQLLMSDPGSLAKREPTEELVKALREQLRSQAEEIKIKNRQIQELHLLLRQCVVKTPRNFSWPFSR